MISQLQKHYYDQQKLIHQQSGIIDELFSLLCERMSKEEIKSLEPLLSSIKDTAERMDKCIG